MPQRRVPVQTTGNVSAQECITGRTVASGTYPTTKTNCNSHTPEVESGKVTTGIMREVHHENHGVGVLQTSSSSGTGTYLGTIMRNSALSSSPASRASGPMPAIGCRTDAPRYVGGTGCSSAGGRSTRMGNASSGSFTVRKKRARRDGVREGRNKQVSFSEFAQVLSCGLSPQVQPTFVIATDTIWLRQGTAPHSKHHSCYLNTS